MASGRVPNTMRIFKVSLCLLEIPTLIVRVPKIATVAFRHVRRANQQVSGLT